MQQRKDVMAHGALCLMALREQQVFVEVSELLCEVFNFFKWLVWLDATKVKYGIGGISSSDDFVAEWDEEQTLLRIDVDCRILTHGDGESQCLASEYRMLLATALSVAHESLMNHVWNVLGETHGDIEASQLQTSESTCLYWEGYKLLFWTKFVIHKQLPHPHSRERDGVKKEKKKKSCKLSSLCSYVLLPPNTGDVHPHQ